MGQVESSSGAPEGGAEEAESTGKVKSVETSDQDCAWCGQPAASKRCARCGYLYLCSEECMHKIHKTHRHICVRNTRLVADPSVSSLFLLGDPVWESAHQGLRGKYCVDEEGMAMMDGCYQRYEEKPDYFLVLSASARKHLLGFLDVKSLCRMEQAMCNVYALMAWFEALQGLESKALNTWPRYSSAGKFAGLRWSMNRRVQLSKVTIPKVVVPGRGEVRDKGEIFDALCKNEAWADIACMLVQSRSMIDVQTLYRSDSGVGWTPLMMAAAYNRVDVAEACIKARAAVDKATPNRCTALYIASQQGHVDVARLLVDSGADINKAEKDGRTPLYIASWQGHVAVAWLLVDSGAAINKAEKIGGTPLYIASVLGHVNVAWLLVDNGVDIDKATKDRCTPLYVASGQGYVNVARLLVGSGADVDKATRNGVTPLMIASENGHEDVVRLLVDSGADIDKAEKNGCTPLVIASHQGHAEVARLLVDSGADIHKATKNGWTPLKIARLQGHTAIVKLLLAAGARG